MKEVFGAAALAILLSAPALTAAGISQARAADTNTDVYRPMGGFSYSFESKIAVGYFMQKDQACALNLFLAENAEYGAGPSAARLQMKVGPEETIKLGAPEGQTLDIKCGDGAATLVIARGSVPARYAER